MRRGTYSIVAHDADTGELGVAVQSHWFAVGPVVPWVQTGGGAVCTPSVIDSGYGPRVLELLQDGAAAAAALEGLVATDALARYRQVGAVDSGGQAVEENGAVGVAYQGRK